MGCNRPGKKLNGEKDSAFLTARHISYIPNFPKLLKICKHILSKTRYKQVERGKEPQELRAKPLTEKGWYFLLVTCQSREKRLHLLIEKAESLVTSHLGWGTLVKSMFIHRYLSKCWVLIFYSFIWCLAPVQQILIYPKQHSHSNSNSTKQTAARFWTNVPSTCFLLRHVFLVEKRMCMRRKYYLMTVPLQPNALGWEGVYWLWR